MASAPYTLDLSQSFDFGGPRPVGQIAGICVHTSENDSATRAIDVARYQVSSRTGSYHVIVDDHGARVLCNTDDWATWSSGNRGNDVLLHICLVGRASWKNEQWTARHTLLSSAAQYVAYWCRLYNIDPVWIGAAELKSGRKGITSHYETGRAWGGTDHTDPGPGFPVNKFLADVKARLTVPTQPKDDDMTPAQARQLAEVWDQLRGPGGKGWPQLNGKTIVDKLADVDAKLDKLLGKL